ncbi:MAG: IPT/TIG domain-containing protein [Gemmatimonadetes bacterium]|nr:IPT/TIG domain-containing protein [Gemmatimonadota bacterium]
MTPSTFTGGDTITVQGSGFAPGAIVEIGGATARVLAVNPSGTAITATVPVCLAAGSVSVVVRVRTAPSNAASGTYTTATGPLRLAVGDYAVVDPLAVAGCARFPAAGLDSVKYLLAPQLVTGRAGDSTTYQLVGDSALAAPAVAPGVPATLPFALRFHDHLRGLEAGYAALPRPAPVPRAAAAEPQAAPSLGAQRSFRVCNVVTCSKTEDFTQVTATLRYVGKHAAIYQDVTAPADGFSDQDFQALGEVFDSDLSGVDTRAFGVESDVDANGVVFILFTPVVNRLTPKDQCSQSFVTGFFYAIDIDPAFQEDSRSNQAEVFYAIVPDPQQTVTCRFSVSAVRRLVPVTFVHEFQHMISYYHHVMLRGGSSEALWLNEAMSHLAEELGGFHFLAQRDTARFSEFVLGDLFNAYKYLKDPGARFALFKSGTGTLEERGAAWLFLRWVVDQFGDDVTRRLSETGLSGANNVAAATGEPVATLLPQWFLANYVSDLPGFTAPSRLTYRTWSFRRTYADLHRQSPTTFDRPFPLEPAVFLGGTFNVSDVLRAGSGDYFLAVQIAGQKGFGLQFMQSSGVPFPSSLPARLNVIRLR